MILTAFKSMKYLNSPLRLVSVMSGLSAVLLTSTFSGHASIVHVGRTAEPDANAEAATSNNSPADSTATIERNVTLEAPSTEQSGRKDVPWLGVSTIEASEALASQLNLQPGVGLIVTYLAPDGPAAKAGLRKNDVLVEFDNQPLVHPAQLRKLVRVHNDGDEVKLGYFRAGKRETASVALGHTRMRPGTWEEEGQALKGNLNDLQRQLGDLHIDDLVRQQMHALRESLGNIKIDQKEVQENIRRGMEQARVAIQDALRNVATNDPIRKVLENLAHSGVVVDDKADVVVRSSGQNVKSLVKSDDNGTIVLIRNPRLYLTAHGKDGKLLFDGPIESTEERGKVPAELWSRVEPLLDQMRAPAEEPETKPSQ